MVDDPEQPPGGGGVSTLPAGKSWASVLGSSLKPKNDKNVLEVVLEKDMRGAYVVKDQECANLMRRMGLDQRPGVEVEEVQICPQGRGVIFITLNREVDIGRFCRHDVIDVTESGIRSVMVKPAGKREVIVSIRGIHPNTRDDVVLDYLARFGKLCSTKVVYGVYSDGALKGFKNGDRSYKLEIKPSVNLGSYHFIDGQKVTIRYPGQQQTCGRCHRTPQDCRGKGIARKCEAEGGSKVEFSTYILDLWKKIGYSPENLELGEDGLQLDEDQRVHEQHGGTFTPVKVSPNTEKFTGVSIRQFPKESDNGEIIEFLIKCGLPESKTENLTLNSRGVVVVRNLENSECLELIEAIHGKTHFERKLFCNGIVPLSPQKAEDAAPPKIPPSSAETLTAPSSSNASLEQLVSGSTKEAPGSSNFQDFASASSSSILGDIVSTCQLVRRHSMSIIDRSPPTNSLAAELLASSNLTRISRQNIMSDIADIQGSLSEFNSCIESSEESSSTSENEVDKNLKNENIVKHVTMNDKKRQKKRKRKSASTPGKEDFLKKQNIQSSPPPVPDLTQ